MGRPEVQGFYGALAGQRANKGVFITTSGYTAQAVEFAKSVEKIVLVDGSRLVELMIDHEVGVSTRTIKVPKVTAITSMKKQPDAHRAKGAALFSLHVMSNVASHATRLLTTLVLSPLLAHGQVPQESTGSLGSGFRIVHRSQVNAPGSFEGVGHFSFVYFGDQLPCQCGSGSFFISPSGASAMFTGAEGVTTPDTRSGSRSSFGVAWTCLIRGSRAWPTSTSLTSRR